MNNQNKRLVAVCGKGGSGKTALIALMTRHLIKHGREKLLVIDADPTMNLAPVLGVEINKTVNDIREKIIRESRGIGLKEKQDLARSLDYMLFEALIEADGFTLLVMGRPESLGCYCPVNDLLRSGIELLAKSFDTILIDGEAGVEQINRQVTRSVDTPVVVSDLSIRGLQTAALIKKVIETNKIIKFSRIGLVLNRAGSADAGLKEQIEKTGLDLFGMIPEDEILKGYDMKARPLLELPDDSPSVRAVRNILVNIGLAR